MEPIKRDGEGILAVLAVMSALDLLPRVAIIFQPSLVVVHDENFEVVRVCDFFRQVDFVVLVVEFWILAVTLALPQQFQFKVVNVFLVFIITVVG